MRNETMQELWRAPVRMRLVRLCAMLSVDPAAAEDLAQETLLEAWWNAHKLHDPAGAERWLAAIARNVCPRNARRRSRDPLAPRQDAADEQVEVDSDLERAELLELLDRALGLLPPKTRDAIVQRYVDDAPHGEIATRLGVSEDAVSMRLARGKTLSTVTMLNVAAGWSPPRGRGAAGARTAERASHLARPPAGCGT